MKKIFSLLSLITMAICCVCITSCGDNNDEPPVTKVDGEFELYLGISADIFDYYDLSMLYMTSREDVHRRTITKADVVIAREIDGLYYFTFDLDTETSPVTFTYSLELRQKEGVELPTEGSVPFGMNTLLTYSADKVGYRTKATNMSDDIPANKLAGYVANFNATHGAVKATATVSSDGTIELK